MDIRTPVRDLLNRTLAGRTLLEARRKALVPEWWARNRADEVAMAVIIATILGHDGNAVDVGAAKGGILQKIVDRAPDGHHVAFEPVPHLAAALREHFPTVDIHEAAVADVSGQRVFLVAGDDAWSSLEGNSYAAAIEPAARINVAVEALDDALPADYRPDIIKIDVEGGEVDVILGAQRKLAAHKPILIIEHGGMGAGSAGPADLFPPLADLGYEIFDIDGNGPYDLPGMVEEFERGKIWNWLAVAQ